jgi:hypothetical protein
MIGILIFYDTTFFECTNVNLPANRMISTENAKIRGPTTVNVRSPTCNVNVP